MGVLFFLLATAQENLTACPTVLSRWLANLPNSAAMANRSRSSTVWFSGFLTGVLVVESKISCLPPSNVILAKEGVAKGSEQKGTTKTRRHKVFSGRHARQTKKGFLCALVSLWFKAFMPFATTSKAVIHASQQNLTFKAVSKVAMSWPGR